MFSSNIDSMIILQQPYRLIEAFAILCGFRMLNVLTTMCIYEWKYYKNAGEDYLSYGKRYVLRLRIIQWKYNEMRYTKSLKKYFHAK